MDAGGLGMGGCGWMWMMDVVGVALLLRCGGVYTGCTLGVHWVYTAESDAQHPSTRRLSIYLEYLSPPRVYLSIYSSIATLSRPFSMPPASSTSAPPASTASAARPIT